MSKAKRRGSRTEVGIQHHALPGVSSTRSGKCRDGGYEVNMSASASAYRSPTAEGGPSNESQASGVSWAAIFAGAVVAAAMALSLTTLGAGIGLSSVSPWAHSGASAGSVATGAIVWMVLVQALSAVLGGYVAGRLRTKWVNVHSDEVYFRDTAHGFVVWALAVTLMAAVLTSAATSVVEGAGHVAGHAAGMVPGAMRRPMGGEPMAPDGAGPFAYYADELLRTERPAADGNDAAVRAELGRIVATSIRNGKLSQADQAYLSQVVAARTGLSATDAQQRVAASAGGRRSSGSQCPRQGRRRTPAPRRTFPTGCSRDCCSVRSCRALQRRSAGASGTTCTPRCNSTASVNNIEESVHEIDTAIVARRSDSVHHPDRPVQSLLITAFAGPAHGAGPCAGSNVQNHV